MKDLVDIYLAGPLFSQAQWNWNLELKRVLERRGTERAAIRLILPQEKVETEDYGTWAFAERTYLQCLTDLTLSDVVLANLDGSKADDGTCFEVGFAVAKNIPVIGFRTDPRPGEWQGCNLMLSVGCEKAGRMISTSTKDIEVLAKNLILAIQDVLEDKA